MASLVARPFLHSGSFQFNHFVCLAVIQNFSLVFIGFFIPFMFFFLWGGGVGGVRMFVQNVRAGGRSAAARRETKGMQRFKASSRLKETTVREARDKGLLCRMSRLMTNTRWEFFSGSARRCEHMRL